MTKNSLLKQQWFWNIVSDVLIAGKEVDLDLWCKQYQVNLDQFNVAFEYLKTADLDIDLKLKSGQKYICTRRPLARSSQSASNITELEESNLLELASSIEETRSTCVDYKAMNLSEINIDMNLVTQIQESITAKHTLSIQHDGRELNILPWKVVYIDGELSLICEKTSDKCLLNIPIQSISHYTEGNKSYESIYSLLELEEFISSLREMSDYTIRLVLKIYARDEFSVSLNEAFFNNSCLVTNSCGDLIWAATLEPCDRVFKWLYELEHKVEILEPYSFKRDFLDYCEDRLKKLA